MRKLDEDPVPLFHLLTDIAFRAGKKKKGKEKKKKKKNQASINDPVYFLASVDFQ